MPMQCPKCYGEMETVSSDSTDSLHIDRCHQCQGLYFNQLTRADMGMLSEQVSLDTGDDSDRAGVPQASASSGKEPGAVGAPAGVEACDVHADAGRAAVDGRRDRARADRELAARLGLPVDAHAASRACRLRPAPRARSSRAAPPCAAPGERSS